MVLETSDASKTAAGISASTLPPELWLSVASHLAPKELLSVGETCRYLREFINQRHVWTQALQSLCHQRHLYVPSFPIDEMGLAQLQSAVLGPHQWCKLISKHHEMHQSTSRTFKPSHSRALNVTRHDDFPSIQYLVPGGRFLVVASRACLEMWDLGAPGSQLEDPRLFASTPILIEQPSKPMNEVLDIDMCPYGSDGDGLRIAVRGRDVDWVPFVILYEISLQRRDAVFCERGTLHFGAGFHRLLACSVDEVRMSMTDRVLLISSKPYGVIWDFIGGRYRFWYVRRGGSCIEPVEVAVLQDHILHIFLGYVDIWSLSSLPQAPKLDGPLPASNLPETPRIASHTRMIFGPDFPNHQWRQFILPSSWYMSRSTSLTFDTIFEDPRSASAVSAHRYKLSLCETDEWEIERLGDFTLLECDGAPVRAPAFAQRSNPLDIDIGHSSVTPIRTLTLRSNSLQFTSAIYTIVRSPAEVGGQSGGGEMRGSVTTLQKENAFSMWVCAVSGRVTWIPAPGTTGYVPGLINVDSYFS